METVESTPAQVEAAAPEAPPPSPVTEPATQAPKRERRRVSRRDERQAAAERAKRYRERKRGRDADPEELARRAAQENETKAQAEATAKMAAALLVQKEEMVRNALAGTIEASAETVQLVWLDGARPKFGHERADYVASLWAPILAPLINEDTAKWLPLLLATGGTANALFQWAHEYKTAQADDRPPLRVARDA